MAGAGVTLRSSPSRVIARLESAAACWAVLAAAMALYGALVLWVGRETTLFVDEALLFEGSRGLDAEALLTPLNGHLVLAVRGIYATVFELAGASFVVLQLIQALAGMVVAGLLFELLRRRVGPPAALAPTLLLLFLGSAWEANFIVSGLTNTLSIAFGLGALLALEPGDEKPGQGARDLWACALLVASVSTWSFGIAVTAGVAALVFLQPQRARRLWIVAVPLALYGAWRIWLHAGYAPEHGVDTQIEPLNALLVPNFLANEAAAVAGAVSGLNFDFNPGDVLAPFSTESAYGAPLAILAILLLALRLRRGGARPQLWALLVALLAFWIALALTFGPGRSPTTVRYVYPGAVLVFLLAGEAATGMRPSRTALLALFAALTLALGANLYRLDQGAGFFREYATSLRAELTALELAVERVDPGFTIEPGLRSVRAGPYLDAVDRNGSPAFTPDELLAQADEIRTQADAVLASALGVGLDPTGQPRGPCDMLSGRAGSLSFEVASPESVVRAQRDGTLALRRFADTATVPLGQLEADEPMSLDIPSDRSTQPWQAIVTSPGRVEVCR